MKAEDRIATLKWASELTQDQKKREKITDMALLALAQFEPVSVHDMLPVDHVQTDVGTYEDMYEGWFSARHFLASKIGEHPACHALISFAQNIRFAMSAHLLQTRRKFKGNGSSGVWYYNETHLDELERVFQEWLPKTQYTLSLDIRNEFTIREFLEAHKPGKKIVHSEVITLSNRTRAMPEALRKTRRKNNKDTWVYKTEHLPWLRENV